MTELHDGYVELDRDLLEHERDLEGDEDEVDRLTAELEHSQLEAHGSLAKKEAARRLKWDYLIYVRQVDSRDRRARRGKGANLEAISQALGCTLPPPLASVARTKKDGVSFLEVSICQAVSRGKRMTVDDEFDRPNKPRSTRPARS